jgi:hypothetical protein
VEIASPAEPEIAAEERGQPLRLGFDTGLDRRADPPERLDGDLHIRALGLVRPRADDPAVQQ